MNTTPANQTLPRDRWGSRPPNPVLSVIVPTFNSDRTLVRCLRSLYSQDFDGLEVIVVDNESSDRTNEILQSFGVRTIRYRAGRAEARNLGARQSQSPFLLHMDSDMEAPPGLARSCIEALESAQGDAVIIPEVVIGSGYWARCLDFQKRIASGVRGREAARFIKRQVFEAIGGYDIRLEAGEDFDLHYRIELTGANIARVNCTIKHNVDDISFKDLRRKILHYGETVDKFRRKNAAALDRNPRETSILARNLGRVLRDPLHAIGYVFLAIVARISQPTGRERQGWIQRETVVDPGHGWPWVEGGVSEVGNRQGYFVRDFLRMLSSPLRVAMTVAQIRNAIQMLENWQEVAWWIVGRKPASGRLVFKLRNGVLFELPPIHGARLLDSLTLFTLREVWRDDVYGHAVRIRDGDIIVDAGANVGYFAVKAALSSPRGRVVAIEPVPFLNECLKHNIHLNKLANIEISSNGLMDKRGSVTLWIDPSNLGGHSAFLDSPERTTHSYVMDAVTLEDIFTNFRLPRIDLLKMDVEGAEFPVLLTAEHATFQKIHRISLEYHLGPGRTVEELRGRLLKAGYDVQTSELAPDRGMMWAFRRSSSPKEVAEEIH